MLNRQSNGREEGWELSFDDLAFPYYLLVRARGVLDVAFFMQLLTDLEAYMAATVGMQAPYAPIIIDARRCFPTRQGIDALFRLIGRKSCRATEIVLWISQRGAYSSIQHSVALMLRTALRSIQIANNLDEALWLLGLPAPIQQPVQPSLGSYIARWSA